jgi:hypothetical protein
MRTKILVNKWIWIKNKHMYYEGRAWAGTTRRCVGMPWVLHGSSKTCCAMTTRHNTHDMPGSLDTTCHKAWEGHAMAQVPPLLLHHLNSMKCSKNLSWCRSLRWPLHTPSSSCGRHSSSASARTCSCSCSCSSSDACDRSFDGACAQPCSPWPPELGDEVPMLPAPVAHAWVPLSVLLVRVHALESPAQQREIFVVENVKLLIWHRDKRGKNGFPKRQVSISSQSRNESQTMRVSWVLDLASHTMINLRWLQFGEHSSMVRVS